MYIRKLLDDEYEEVIKLIRESVHTVCREDYTQNELEAWAPKIFDAIKFRKALDGCNNLVMIDALKITGFISVDRSGYVNRLYTHKDYQRRKIATRLLERAEEWALNNRIYELTLDSSKTAVPFYLRSGFEKIGTSTMECQGVVFHNTVMRKKLCNSNK